jgi:hypothetical protein
MISPLFSRLSAVTFSKSLPDLVHDRSSGNNRTLFVFLIMVVGLNHLTYLFDKTNGKMFPYQRKKMICNGED